MPKGFQKGNSGKPKGATNKLTRTFKEILALICATLVFESL